MLITFVAATTFEIAPLKTYLDEHYESSEAFQYQGRNIKIHLLITGVGMVHTAYSLGRYLAFEKPQLLINAGIAGAFNEKLTIGEVVNVVSERFADLGVEEGDSRFTDIHELGLIDQNQFPYIQGQLWSEDGKANPFLPQVHGLTVNKVHGTAASIAAIQKKYKADVESMEGASVFLACLTEQVPFLEIRSISNRVEVRNKENWNIPLAIEALNEVLIQMLSSFEED